MKKLLQFDAGETIIKEGDVGESAFMIEDGKVEVSRSVDDQKVILASLGSGEIFGEMSMIDDCPRGATITATTATTVSELPRNEFLDHLQSEPEFAVSVLRSIFERLRDANSRIQQLEQESGAATAEAGAAVNLPAVREAQATDRRLSVTLEGLTPEAGDALPSNPYRVENLPFLVGRKSSDPLVHNHLSIADERPWQISRHHMKLVIENGQICAVDRGSTLGSMVDGQAVGGRFGTAGPVALKEPEGFLVLGIDNSPYRYKVHISE